MARLIIHGYGPVNEKGSVVGRDLVFQMYSPVTMLEKMSSASIKKMLKTKVRIGTRIR